MDLFFSYARPDRPKADSLAQRLRQAGNDVWLDTELTGGQVWWDKILYQLRKCDAFVAIVSWASIKSQACGLERHYAMSLRKPVLPVAVEPIRGEVLPPDLARLQLIDYSQPGEAAAYQLVGSIMRLAPPPSLPNPLPEPPEVPISYLASIAARLSAPTLSMDEQFGIVGTLEDAITVSADPSDRASALELLAEMEGRSDLLAAVYRRISAIKNTVSQTGSSQSYVPPQQDIPRQEPPKRDAANGEGARYGKRTNTAQDQQREPPRSPPLRQQTPRQQPRPAAISSHWAMAVTALVVFWPLGIAAVVFASRVQTKLRIGDLASAQKSSSRVKVIFWISIALLALILIIAIASSNSNSQASALVTLAARLGSDRRRNDR